ncbi:MAG: 50S ribosomal protein L18 [Candidatus Omnitrophica bacterium]|nr:50S ribosomal protein L18 [Candidatus Omnitrophota bacterium]
MIKINRKKNLKEYLRIKRHRRIRQRVIGSQQRPRLSIHRSIKHLYAQLIDDTKSRILFSLSTTSHEIKKKIGTVGNIKQAQLFGEIFGKEIKDKGFNQVVFDRGGYLYHGRIKAFAEAVRKQGVNF